MATKAPPVTKDGSPYDEAALRQALADPYDRGSLASRIAAISNTTYREDRLVRDDDHYTRNMLDGLEGCLQGALALIDRIEAHLGEQ